MELPLTSKGHHKKPRIGSKYQVDVPSFKSSARIKSQEYNTRDHLYAWGQVVPITRIVVDSQSPNKKRKLSTDQASCSNVSTVNSMYPDEHELHIISSTDVELNGGRHKGSTNSCASSSKEQLVIWNQDCVTTEDGPEGEGNEEEAATILPKKKKKRSYKRNCWQPKKRVSKKPRLEIYAVEEDGKEEDFDLQRRIVPGTRSEAWSQAEVAIYSLAIFLFGKRFCIISKFIGSRKVIDVIDYYYSKFYGRLVWARWKAAKSFKCKVAVRGEMVLMGWRGRLLLKRLKLVVSDDAYCEIIKATSDFNVTLPDPDPNDEIEVAEYLRTKEEKLDKYVFTLKDVVGLELLEKSVAIGGPQDGNISKRDLTSGPYPAELSRLRSRRLKEKHTRGAGKSQDTPLVPLGNENFWSVRSEDSLQSTLRKRNSTFEEIAQHFWERVWPALEREGWRTAERKLTVKSNPKLMFLRPGVDKLHREERGISYFDDLNQVIEAVENDPSLRELAEDPMDGSDAPDEEEEVRGGWSDDEDMFTTLDGKRTIVPPTLPLARPRAREDSSHSSSVDIDLNRMLSDVNSKPQEESTSKTETLVGRNRGTQDSCEKKHGFPLGGIDLNLLPADYECIADAGAATDNLDRLECEFLDSASIRKLPEPEPVSLVMDVGHSETELTLSLGNFTNQVFIPCPSPLLRNCNDDACEQQENANASNELTTPFQFVRSGFSHQIKILPRRRSLRISGCDGQGDWFDNGKELVSVPKKRAITLDRIPRGLGELPVTTFLIRMNKAAVTQLYPEVSSCIDTMPVDWWRPSMSLKVPFEGLSNIIQDSASDLLNSACRLRAKSSFESVLKTCQDTSPHGLSHCWRSASMPSFQKPRLTRVEGCTASEEINFEDKEDKRDSLLGVEGAFGHIKTVSSPDSLSEVEGALGPVTTVSSHDSAKKSIIPSAVCTGKLPLVLMGSSLDTVQVDTQAIVPPVTSPSQNKGGTHLECFRQPGWRVVNGNTSSSDEHERGPVQEEVQHEEAPTPKPHIQVKSIRIYFKDRGDNPVAYKERTKRVPRNYSSGLNPNPKGWRRSDHGDFSSLSESLNSCLTFDSFPANGRDEEEAPHGAQLRVKSEDNDVMVSASPSVSSWGTGEQDEEILREDHEEEKPFLDECKTSREMYSASTPSDYFDSSLYKPRKRRCDTSVSRKRNTEDSYLGANWGKKFKSSPDNHNNGDVCAETSDKRMRVNHEDLVFKKGSVVEDMYRVGYEVLPGEGRENQGVEFASKKLKDKRSKPKRQRKNVSCERFLTMLYMEGVEEELPVQSRSSQGPFQAPSHMPHLRGARPNKVFRSRRPLLPCRSNMGLPRWTGLKRSTSASPKRPVDGPVSPMEEEVTSDVAIVKWPEQDGRFTLRRTPSELSAKSGPQCNKRAGGRRRHCCIRC